MKTVHFECNTAPRLQEEPDKLSERLPLSDALSGALTLRFDAREPPMTPTHDVAAVRKSPHNSPTKSVDDDSQSKSSSLEERILQAARQELQCLNRVRRLQTKRSELRTKNVKPKHVVRQQEQLERLVRREQANFQRARELRNRRYRWTQLMKLQGKDTAELPPLLPP